jgi:L-lactate dehydrogenase
MKEKHIRKVVIIGAGDVGATYAYALAQSGLADEIAIIDKHQDLARGQVLDLTHGEPYFPSVVIRQGQPEDYHDAQLIVIAAGAAQQSGETRLDLLNRNAEIMRNIMDDIASQHPSGVILIVSNPVDVMTYVAVQHSHIDKRRIIGSGTVLDSARLRQYLSEYCDLDIHNVHAYVLGEHGDSEFVPWSMAHLSGLSIDDYCLNNTQTNDWPIQRQKIEQAVRDSAYHIIDYKGATCFGVGMALVRISGAILRGEKSVLTVSTLLEGEYGCDDVCLSVPCLVSEQGIEQIITATLPEHEQSALLHSASTLKQAISSLG